MSLLDESLAVSSELGMRPLMERVLVIWTTLSASAVIQPRQGMLWRIR